jgi:Spy/CpxP family protein refolding chaperone
MMKGIVALAVAAVMIVGIQGALAGEGCCPAKAAAKAGCGDAWAKCDPTLAKIDLTAEQKAKLAEIEKSCAAEGRTKEACEKYKGEMKKVLTADQLAAYEAACKKDGSSCKSGT